MKRPHMPSRVFVNCALHKAALSVCQTLQAAGHEAVYVGGVVRDMVLWPEVLPHDIDIATSAAPEAVAALFPGSGFVGKSFGVSLVKEHNFAFEVATFRKEGNYSNRRHPDSVGHGSRQDDSLRRDFTINALFFDPVSQEIEDFHGGLADLQARTLRCVGEARERLFEDPLRILRLFRFAVGTGFSIAPETLAAAKEPPVAEGMRLLSKERILAEIVKVKPGCAPLFFAGFLSAFEPSLVDPAFAPVRPSAPHAGAPCTQNIGVGSATGSETAPAQRLSALAQHEVWRRHPLLHRKFPATVFGLFLRACANEPCPEPRLFQAFEAWPLQVADRELLRVLYSLSAGLEGMQSAQASSYASRAMRFFRLLRPLREVTPQELVGLASLPGAVATAEARECLSNAEHVFRSEAARSEEPLSEFLRWLPSCPVPWLPARASLNAFREDEKWPQTTLGTLHMLWDALALQGDAVPLEFRVGHEGPSDAWKAAWRSAALECQQKAKNAKNGTSGKMHFQGIRFGAC